MKNKIFNIFLLAAISSSISAQSSLYKWGAGVHAAMYSFNAVKNSDYTTLSGSYSPGVRFSLMRRLGNSFDGGLGLGLARVYYSKVLVAKTPMLEYYESDLTLRYKFDNGYILKTDSWIAPFLKTGFGVNMLQNFDNKNMYVPAGAGVLFRLNKIAADVILQGAYNYGLQNAASFVNASLGLNLNFGERVSNKLGASVKIQDRDYDSIADEIDGCPDVYGPVVSNGCPDADGDGIKDSQDKCPTQAGYANLLGCLDSDYDSVIDPEDACPNQYGEELNGCPTAKLADKDGDNVPDERDECPDTPGFFTALGCPDADGDGVKDSEDTCPNEYGSKTNKGCAVAQALVQTPESVRPSVNTESPTMNTTVYVTKEPTPTKPSKKVKETVSTYTPEVTNNTPRLNPNEAVSDEEFCKRVSMSDLGNAYFNVNVTKPQENSFNTLSNVVEIMRRCSDLKITISGHADSDGNEVTNLELSQKRANAIKDYLIKKGISARRLIIQAFGESKPINAGDNANGKQTNRRVEFELNRGF
jgi:outer membrane protein OmpA-like peptidoglycan-associated protein